MGFKSITWKVGDLIDVTRLNQYVENDDYLFDILSVAQLVNNSSDKWVDAFSPHFRLKIDGNYSGTPVIADLTANQFAEYRVSNISIQSLSAGTHTVTETQGTDESVSHTFYKHPEMNYLTFWVELGNSTPDDTPTYGRRNFMLIGSRDQI